MTFYIVLALSVFLLSLIGTRLTIQALRKRPALPNLRGFPAPPVRGGIALVFVLVIGLLVADIHYGVVLAILLLAAVSLLHDLIGVPPLVRLLVQVLAVSLPLSFLAEPVFGGALPVWLDRVAAIGLWIWFINLFNAMDGIDGLAAGEMICISGGLVLLASLLGAFPSPLSSYSMVAATAGCGFFWWSRYPAKVALGEAGNVPIGFLMGYLLLLAILAGYGYAAAILPAYYLADSTVTLIRQAWRGNNIFRARTEHYYQQAVRRGRHQGAVVRYILGINLLLILLATLSVLDPEIAIFNLAIAYMAVFMLLGFFAHTDPHPHHEHL